MRGRTGGVGIQGEGLVVRFGGFRNLAATEGLTLGVCGESWWEDSPFGVSPAGRSLSWTCSALGQALAGHIFTADSGGSASRVSSAREVRVLFPDSRPHGGQQRCPLSASHMIMTLTANSCVLSQSAQCMHVHICIFSVLFFCVCVCVVYMCLCVVCMLKCVYGSPRLTLRVFCNDLIHRSPELANMTGLANQVVGCPACLFACLFTCLHGKHFNH